MSLFSRRVGRGVAHPHANDLRTVRLLLNANLPAINAARAKSGKPVLLPVAETGPLTSAGRTELENLIGEFQSLIVAPDKPADQRIDPGGATERALLQGLDSDFDETKLGLIIPEATADKITLYCDQIIINTSFYHMDSPLQLAHFIAQVAVESDRLRTAQEYASGAEYEGRADLGNTETGDGVRFKGRGLIQLTGRKNYAAYQAYTEVSYTQDADDANRLSIATDPAVAVDVSCWFWQVNGIKQWAELDDALKVSKAVNLGNPNGKTANLNGKDERLRYTSRAKAVLLPQKV